MDETFSVKVTDLTKVYFGNAVLESINFEAQKGETIGIIGPNGAGKSTLLKILSGIVRPTTGTVTINGSTASILDVGMGFHPDLTGIENVYFAGQFMGFNKAQIQEKMPEIIAFSELEDHMNKPVKFYSSGMYLRLAFSIFALLNSKVLILDEVLSVGDASFRRKSIEWMTDHKKDGRTIVLVSHNLNEIENFCDRVLYIDKKVVSEGTNVRSVILDYMRDHPAEPKIIDPTWLTGIGIKPAGNADLVPVESNLFEHEDFVIKSVKILSEENVQTHSFAYDQAIQFSVNYHKLKRGVAVSFIWKLFDMNESLLLASSPMFSSIFIETYFNENGCFEEQTTIPPLFLNSGRYYVSLVCTVDKSIEQTLHRLITFEVYQNEWVRLEPWCTIPAPILHKFHTFTAKIEE